MISNVLAWNNRVRGIDVNGNGTGVAVCNSTVYDSGRNWQFDETASQTQNLHVLTNNISFDGNNSDTFLSGVDASFNTWNGIAADAGDFLSLDDAIARGTRQLDGSLPVSDFLRLQPNSNLVDAGTDVGIPFAGSAPDLGAFEGDAARMSETLSFSAWRAEVGESITVDDYRHWARLQGSHPCALPIEPGDFNGDGVFDCQDVDALVGVVADQSHLVAFDLTGDGNVDVADLDVWLAIAGAANLPSGGAYLPGDSNLDGSVDGQDFIVWNNNKFTSNAAWCAGDFNADGSVDGQDFIVWNNFKFMNSDIVPSVPEPGLVWLLLPLIASRRVIALL